MKEFDLEIIERVLEYSFKDKELLKTAFIHSSYANQTNTQSNQRLEFLGDAILNFVIADYLFKNFQVEEGQMSRWRSKMVNRETLSGIIEKLKIDDYLMLGKSFGDSEPVPSLKEDLFESLVGAIYTDSNIEIVKKFIFKFIDVENSVKKMSTDYKTALQEEVQKVKGANLVYFTYEVPSSQGTFCAEIYINDIFMARSLSTTKKQAQMDCAQIVMSDPQKLQDALKN